MKYKLKVASPQPINEPPSASSVPSQPTDQPKQEEPAFGNQDNSKPKGDNNSFGKKEFDAGIGADEESDPKHFIQQLAGKLGTTMRSYNKNQGQPDLELEKFAINSVISATHTSEMEESDQDDIINKIKSAGNKDQQDNNPDNEEKPVEDNDTPDFGNEKDSNDQENESVVIEYEENIANNLSIKENFTTFVGNLIKERMNKQIYLNEVVDEVFGIIGNEEKPDVETPTVEPGTKEKETPETTPTRRNKPWRVPHIKENPDPKASA